MTILRNNRHYNRIRKTRHTARVTMGTNGNALLDDLKNVTIFRYINWPFGFLFRLGLDAGSEYE